MNKPQTIEVAILLTLPAFLAAACLSATAVAPTATPEPSSTPLPPPSPSATIEPTLEPPTITPTADLAAPGALDCDMRSQSIKNGRHFQPRETFDMAWQVENWSKGPWEPDAVRFTYYSGSKLHITDTIPLRETVQPGTWSSLIVPMVAPKQSGKYSTTWTLWYGEDDFCHMSLTIYVP